MKKLLLPSLMLVFLNATEVKNNVIIQENILKDTQIINSTVKQGEINLKNSRIEDSIFGKAGDKNEMRDSIIRNSFVSQGTVNVNNSTLLRSNFYSSNVLLTSIVDNNSSVKQGSLTLESGRLEDSNINLINSMNGATIHNSTVSQSEITIDNSTIQNLTLTNTHSIEDVLGAVTITDSLITQGRLSVIGNSTLGNTVITLDSSIDNTNIINSNIDLCSVYISNGATVSGVNITETCTINNTNIHDATVSVGITTITN